MPVCVYSHTHTHTRTHTRMYMYTHDSVHRQGTLRHEHKEARTSDTNTKKQEKSVTTTVDTRAPRTIPGWGNTCVVRVLTISGPTTLSLVLTVKFKEYVQGIGPVICLVNAKLFQNRFRRPFSVLLKDYKTSTHTHSGYITVWWWCCWQLVALSVLSFNTHRGDVGLLLEKR